MLVPLSWLKNYIPIADTPEELAHKLTMAGVEIGDVEQIGAGWDRDKVTVGQVLSVDPHPNADRLTLPTVDLGNGERATVVCGAPNVAAGQKIAFAREGAVIYSAHSGKSEELKRARIRGVESAGMVCSVLELGLGEDHEGILVLDDDAPVGTPLADYLGDAILDAEITPNRPDCLSILGIAHEVAALTGEVVTEPDLSYAEEESSIEDQVKIEIADPELCYRYTASLISGIKIGQSPQWMQQALLKAGQRPINNVVDVTNYVMLEYGQPLHAFDLDRVKEKTVIVRAAREGEVLETLDGERRTLQPPMLAIADARDAVGLAGVMGGAKSEMTADTSTVLLESASFSPANTRRTRTALGINTEASYRFERGIRASLAPIALRRATKLIVELCGGKAARGIVDLYPTDREPAVVQISLSRIRQVLGVDYTMDRVEEVLASLGFEKVKEPGGLIEPVEAAPASEGRDVLWVKVPYWRSDVSIEDDLVEEVARIVGYDTIPTSMLSSGIPQWEPQPMTELKETVKDLMASAGLQETISYPATTLETLAKVESVDEANPPLHIANPLSSEREYMRTSLRASILMTLSSNRRVSQNESIRIFELARVYLPKAEARERDLPVEREVLVGVLSGPRFQTSWTVGATGEDDMGFFDAKGALEHLFSRLGVEVDYQPSEDPTLQPGRVARLLSDGELLGLAGEVRPGVLDGFDLEGYPVAIFEIDMEALLNVVARVDRAYKSASRYPESYRDLALVVDADVPSARIQQILERHDVVVRSTPFDVYRGDGVPEGKKSVAFRVVFQSDRSTLTSEQVDRFQGDIVRQLRRQLGAELRT